MFHLLTPRYSRGMKLIVHLDASTRVTDALFGDSSARAIGLTAPRYADLPSPALSVMGENAHACTRAHAPR